METPARYFDGVRPVPQAVRLLAHEGGIGLDPGEGGSPLLWADAEIRLDQTDPDIRLHRVVADQDTGERLVIGKAAFEAAFGAKLATLNRKRAGEAGPLRILLWSVAAIVSIVLSVLYGLPLLARAAAPLVPFGWEQALGRSIEPQVLEVFSRSGKDVALCGKGESPGKAALDKMVTRLSAHAGLPGPLAVDVLDTPMINAFALPGGRIFLFRPIIDKASSPDEVAGVLAHEIGHVIHRDAMRGIIHDGALSLLVGLVLGDVTGGSTATILSKMMLGNAYSRDKESEADKVSVDLMLKAGADPAAINNFFRRLAMFDGKGSSLITIFSTHPVTSERIAAVEKMTEGTNQGKKPILDAAEWQALRNICAVTAPVAEE